MYIYEHSIHDQIFLKAQVSIGSLRHPPGVLFVSSDYLLIMTQAVYASYSARNVQKNKKNPRILIVQPLV